MRVRDRRAAGRGAAAARCCVAAAGPGDGAAAEGRRASVPDGTVLVTGGTGGARRAASPGTWSPSTASGDLLLASRRGPDAPGAAELAAELAGLGAEVAVAACDVADRDALAGCWRSREHPLTGVVHAAGVLDDGVVAALTAGAARRACCARRSTPRWHLHELTGDLDLAAFVLFSSVGRRCSAAPGRATTRRPTPSSTRSPQHRRGAGLPAISLAWGLWARTAA